MAVVVAAGAGYWFLTPKMPNELVSTVQQTSLLTPLERSQTSTESTILASATTVASATTAWINVTATQPVNYYLSLLESNGSQPHVQLAKELRKLPDLKNATAVAKIAYLALNATNPEVKEAFQLMIKGGTPAPSDFTYAVPNYNTELQVLYWLALQNDFKKDDTLALAIAMVNGLWITVGDDKVGQAVHRGASDMLVFGRETSEMQRTAGLLYDLDSYPLEAKIAWAWTGSMTPNVPSPNEYVLVSPKYLGRRLDIFAYEWMTADPAGLREKRSWLMASGLMNNDLSKTVESIEYYLYFDRDQAGKTKHWRYSRGELGNVTVDGIVVASWGINNADFQFENLVTKGYGIGNCRDESTLADVLLKSIGVASDITESSVFYDGHTFVMYFDPNRNAWGASERQIGVGSPWAGEGMTYVFVPPINQHGYLRAWTVHGDIFAGNQYYVIRFDTYSQISSMLHTGIPTHEVRDYFWETPSGSG